MQIHIKKIIIFVSFLLVFASISFGRNNQPLVDYTNNTVTTTFDTGPNVEWHKTYGENYTDDTVGGIITTEDGGYIIIGLTFSYDKLKYNSWILKIDSNGESIWNKTYEEPIVVFLIDKAFNNGYIVCGINNSYNTDNFYLLKIDENGNELWNRTYIKRGTPYGIYQINDGYLVLGDFKSDNRYARGIFKVDLNGTLIWYKQYNGFCFSMTESNDGGYILAGEESDSAMIIKIDEDGNQQWKRLYADIGLEKCFYSIEKSNDGNWTVIGKIYYYNESVCYIWFVKINEFGNLLIDKIIDGPYDTEAGHDIEQTFDEGYIIVGVTEDIPGGEGRMSMLKTDSQGNKCWEKIIDGYIFSCNDIVHQTVDGGYILTGMTKNPGIPKSYPNIFVTKFCSDFNNNPPEKPYIEGRADGITNTWYEFRFSSIDPDGDSVKIFIDWGDGQNESIQGSSGEIKFLYHAWYKSGDFTISAQATDEHGTKSEWSTSPIHIPKIKVINTPLFLQKFFLHFSFF